MFKEYINNFTNNLNSLREFVEMISQMIESDTSIREDEKQGANLLTLLTKYMSTIDSDEKEKLKLELKQNGVEIEDSGKINVDKDAGIFFLVLEKLLKKVKHKNLLFENSLISLISAVEWFYSQILHYYFEKYPKAAGLDEKSITYYELNKINDITEAKNHLLDSCIENILRGSFKDWINMLELKPKLKMSYLSDYKDEICEVFQRRNLLVHNGGIINFTYFNNVIEKNRDNLKLGKKVEVTSVYLERAICIIELNFILIAAELWKNISKDDFQTRFETLNKIIYYNLENKRYIISKGLCKFIMLDKSIPERGIITSKINYWVSVKLEGNFESIKDEIIETDFSAKDKIFQLMKESLLNNKENFFNLLPKVLQTEDLKYNDLDEWPIFNEINQTEEYKQFKEIHKENYTIKKEE